MSSIKWLFVSGMALVLYLQPAAQTNTARESLSKAKELSRQGEKEQASALYREMMGTYPDNKAVVQEWLMLNMKRSATGEADAIGQLEELGKNYPDNLAIVFWTMFLQAEYNHWEDALKNADKLTSLQPDSAINFLARGQILEGMNRQQEALSSYRKSTLLAPTNANSWQNLAGLLAKTNQLEEAISAYDKAVSLAPGVPDFIYNRACTYCRLGDRAKSLTDLSKAIQMKPSFKSTAATDADFKSLWEDPDFKTMVAP